MAQRPRFASKHETHLAAADWSASASAILVHALIECHLASARILASALREIETEDAARNVPSAVAPRPAPAPSSPPHYELVTVPEALGLLKIGRTKLYSLIAEQKLTAVKIGKSTRVRLADLETLITHGQGSKT
jgi:excisionase family DNA binding protein